MTDKPIIDQVKALLGAETYGEIVPRLEALIGDTDEKKQRASEVLKSVVGLFGYEDKKARYWLDDTWVRWARIDKDIHAIIDGRELEKVDR